MSDIKPGQLAKSTIEGRLKMTLAWLDMSRDELLEVLCKAGEKDRRAIIGNCSVCITALCEAIDNLRVLLGFEPEAEEYGEDD